MDQQHNIQNQSGYPRPRLDVMLYGHDGRGLGHASRTIAIGMALRRLYPELRVLFVSGAAVSQSLIGGAGLDWIKLPSYASKIEDGISTGVKGPANFSKFDLQHYRSEMLVQIVTSLRPRVILVDHSPLGKRAELAAAIAASKSSETSWILGLRAIIGCPKNFWTAATRTCFESSYHSIFWYGDQTVLGSRQVDQIEHHFGQRPIQLGYVSRLHEMLQLAAPKTQKLTGTISLPWLSPASISFIQAIKLAISLRDPDERWRIFVNNDDLHKMRRQFQGLSGVQVEPVGQPYINALVNSRMAVIYGGYNSLMDVLTAAVPALVIMREMIDKEQEEHIRLLQEYCPGSLVVVKEGSVDKKELSGAIELLLKKRIKRQPLNLAGSEAAARQISFLL